jgi:membrane protein
VGVDNPGSDRGDRSLDRRSLLFRFYVARFTDYHAAYGTVGGVIIVLLWFYVSGPAVLIGAELNAEIEHASPDGKDPGQKRATP